MAAMPSRLHGHYPNLARRSRGRRHSDIGGSWGLRRAAAARRRAFLSKIGFGCMEAHVYIHDMIHVSSSTAKEDTCGLEPISASFVYMEALAAMYHSGDLAVISDAGAPTC